MKRSCHRQTTGSDSPERCIISMVPHPSLVATIIVLDVWGSAMNIRYQVDLNEEEKAELTAMLSGGKQGGTQAQAGSDPAGRRRRDQRLCDRAQHFGQRLDNVPDQAPLHGRQSGPDAQRAGTPELSAQAVGQGDVRLVATACSNPP